jgi:5'-nucleotidase
METEKATLFKYNGCINTYSGKIFSFIEPTPDMIDIKDIARGLAFSGHFGGQTPKFFSVAQHSMLVVKITSEGEGADYRKLLAALLHDGSEGYTGDMLKPLKELLPEFKIIENKITAAIFKKYNLSLDYMDDIKPYDLIAQRIEYDNFFEERNDIVYLSPEESYDEYIKTFNSLIEKII